MIDPYNQIIIVKGKRVKFDSLPLHSQERLLSLWKVTKTNKQHEQQEEEQPTEKTDPEQTNSESSDSGNTKGSNTNKGSGTKRNTKRTKAS